MKKVFLLATAAFLFIGVSFADHGKKCKKDCTKTSCSKVEKAKCTKSGKTCCSKTAKI